MPTTTWRTIRDEIARPLGFVQFDTTTAINADALIVSTELQRRFPNDDHFIGWYVVLVIEADGSTTPVNGLGTTVRRVTAYSAATGQLTVRTPNLLDEGSDQVTCALYRFHPDDVQVAFNRARQNIFPQVGIIRDLETLVTGQRQFTYAVPSTMRQIRRVMLGTRYQAEPLAENLFTNGDFETWTNSLTPADWTLSGASSVVTQEVETTNPRNYAVLSGSNSAKLDKASSANPTTLLQTVTPSVATEGVECNVHAWVYCNIASAILIQIAGNATGTAHSGTGWELIKHAQTLSATATNVAAGIRANLASTQVIAYIDEIVLILGQTEVLDRAYEPILNYEHIPPAAGAANGGVLRFSEALPEKRRIRIVGVDMLSSVSVDTDTVEVDGQHLGPVYDLTRSYLSGERANQAQGDTKIMWKRLQSEFHNSYQDGVNGAGSIRVRHPLKVPDAVR